MEAGGAFERVKDPAVARGENKKTSRLVGEASIAPVLRRPL
jgi:hypothetical protein